MSYSSNKKREQMISQIENYSKSEHIEILKIIKHNKDIHVSENNNGCFINLDDVDEDTMCKIEQYIHYVNLKESNLLDIENTKNKLKNDINVTSQSL